MNAHSRLVRQLYYSNDAQNRPKVKCMKLKVGLIGLNSDHLWPVWGRGVIKEVKESGKYELVAASDKNPPLLDRIKKEFGVQRTYSDYHEMLKKEKFDVAVIGCPNSEKADVIEAISEHGIHALIDKTLSANLEQADRIYRAAKKHKIKAIVYYTMLFDAKSQECVKLAKDGTIGRVLQITSRVANSGPEHHGCTKYFLEWLFNKEKNGGGSIMDYCTYGALYSRWILGQPQGVMAVGGRYFKTNIEAEDTGAVLLRYPKALGILQGSWTEFASDTAGKVYPGPHLAVYGTEGAVIWRKTFDDTMALVTSDFPEGKVYKAAVPSAELADAPEYLAYCIENDKPVEGGGSLEVCRDVQEIIEAAYKSIESRKEVQLPIK